MTGIATADSRAGWYSLQQALSFPPGLEWYPIRSKFSFRNVFLSVSVTDLARCINRNDTAGELGILISAFALPQPTDAIMYVNKLIGICGMLSPTLGAINRAPTPPMITRIICSFPSSGPYAYASLRSPGVCNSPAASGTTLHVLKESRVFD